MPFSGGKLIGSSRPGSGRPGELAIEYRQHDEGEPEGRGGDAHERDHAGEVVDPAVAAHGGEDAERDADDEGEEEGDGRQFEGGGRVVGDVLQHRAVRGDGDAKIAVQQIAQENEVSFP